MVIEGFKKVIKLLSECTGDIDGASLCVFFPGIGFVTRAYPEEIVIVESGFREIDFPGTFSAAEDGHEKMPAHDGPGVLLQRFQHGDAEKAAGVPGELDPVKVAVWDWLLGEYAAVDEFLHLLRVQPQCVQCVAYLVFCVPEDAQEYVVGADPVGAGTHSLVPGVA